MNHNFFLSLVWLCGQGRTPPRIYVCFADFLAKIDSQEHGPAVQGHPVGSPPALLPQALKRTHGGPAKPYNTLHLLRRWCALAGSRRVAAPARMSAAGTCARAQDPVSAATVGRRREDRRSPAFSCGVLPSLRPGERGYPRWRRGRRSKYQVEPRLTDLSPSSCLAFSTVLRLKPRWANRAKASLEGTSSC